MPSEKLTKLLDETELKPCKKCKTKVDIVDYLYLPSSGAGYAFIKCPKCGYQPPTIRAQDFNGPADITYLVIDLAMKKWNNPRYTPTEDEKKFLVKDFSVND